MKLFHKKGVLKIFAIFTRKHPCQSLFLSCNFIEKETLAQEFSCEFYRTPFKSTTILTTPFLQNPSRLIFIYTDIFFSFPLTTICLPCRLRKAYAVLWAANRFVGSETPKLTAFDQFWKFKFPFEHFPRNTWFLSVDGPSNYLYLFKNHRQTFLWPEERPSSHFKIIKMWFSPNIKYLPETPTLRIFAAGEASLANY